MKAGRLPLVFVLILLSTSADSQSNHVVQQKEGIIKSIAREAAELYSNRAGAIAKCKCSTHTCSFVPFAKDCHKELGGAKICGPKCKTQKLNYRTTVINTPPGSDPNDLSEELKESICTYRGLEDHLKDFYPEVTHWTYMGTPDGHLRLYPAVTREHNQATNSRLQQCREFDPRTRPWYIAASSAPKDIVFLLDASKSMLESVGSGPGASKWNVAKGTVLAMMKTLTGRDYVNVVVFRDGARTLGNGSPLVSATSKNKATIATALAKTTPSGDTNFDTAFSKAFELLSNACNGKKKSCSGCQQVIVFITDGRDTSKSECRSIKPSNMAKSLARRQAAFKDDTSREAAIFTTTIGRNSDDGLARQIACANNGAWASIDYGEDPLSAMATFYRFMAAGRASRGAVWTAPYIDDLGLGFITTVARPVYSPSAYGSEGVFLGVTGHDVALSDFGVPQKDAHSVVADLIKRSRGCDHGIADNCQRQLLRHANSHKATCIDHFPLSGEITSQCFTDGKTYYKRIELPVDWENARARCEGDGGKLATIENEAQSAFIASMASEDGCWVGARRSGASYFWLFSSAAGMDGRSDYWGNGGVDFGRGVSDCVAIDTRGPMGNLKTAECHDQLTFICAFETDKLCNDVVVKPFNTALGYYFMPSVNVCKRADKHLQSIGEVKALSKVNSRDAICPLGKPKKDSALRCCGRCSS